MTMPAMQTSDLQTSNSSAMAQYPHGLRAFTFWVSDTLYAIDISKVLTISQEMGNIQSLPSEAKGLVGMVEFQDTAVPVLDFANLLGFSSGIENNNELMNLLNEQEREHLDWVEALEDSLLNDTPFLKTKDPNQCSFAKWYDNFKSRDDTLNEVLEELDKPHRAIHELADKLLEIKKNDQTDKALNILREEKNFTLKRLLKRFEQVRSHLKESSRQVLLYITENGTSPTVSLRIDDINDVVDFKPEQFKPMEGINNILNGTAADIVIAYLKQSNQADCLLIDASNLVKISRM